MELARSGRREWLAAVFGAAAGRLLAGCEQRPSRPVPGALVGPSPEVGHRLRDGLDAVIAAAASAPARDVRVVIVGGGPAGLSAARRLIRRGLDALELLELEPELGGTSIGGRGPVTPYPWGAHYLPIPRADNHDLVALLREMDVLEGVDEHGNPRGKEPFVVREPEERLHFHGAFRAGLFPRDGATRADLAELARFESSVARLVGTRDDAGRRAFELPLDRSGPTAELVASDRISAHEWLARNGFAGERLRWWLEYGCRDDYGCRLETTSAWAMLFYHAARIATPGAEPASYLTWPEGNAALVRHLARDLGERRRTHRLVLDVSPTEGGVEVVVLDTRNGRPERLRAERVVVATPQFVSSRIVRPLREGGPNGRAAFTYAPWIVANLHLRDRPRTRGAQLAWDNVIHGSRSLGYVCATHQRGRDHGPTVLTYYLPLAEEEPRAARRTMLEAPLGEWQSAILADLAPSHPDLAPLVERLDVCRWAHAMVRPVPGFVWGDERRAAREPVGAIHFAHSDLSGVALFEEAFAQGIRAADEVLAALRPSALEATP